MPFLSVRGELSILATTNKKNRQSAIESPRLIAVGRTKVASFLFFWALQRGKPIWGRPAFGVSYTTSLCSRLTDRMCWAEHEASWSR